MRYFVGLAVALLILSGCTKKETIEKTISPPEATYVGSSSCSSCHSDQYEEFIRSGHPWKLNKMEDVLAAGGPASYYPDFVAPYWQQPNAGPPPGYNFEDFAYIIGGFGWKARFIKKDGYILTGDQVQYNLHTDEWVAYHSGETKPYSCGECHTTGYVPVGSQDSLEGIVGTWAFPGIQCEECHGPGSLHEEDPYNVAMKIPTSEWEACGRCHSRGDPNVIDAKGGFIKHHEQYEEMIASKKVSMRCTDCHDPHASAVYFPEEAIKVQCETCHFDEAESYETSEYGSEMYNAGVKCIDCHMPYAAKSAVKYETYMGDIRSHLFAINVDSTASMFNQDSTAANGYLTLEFACLYCHDGHSSNGEPAAFVMTKAQAAQYAPHIHEEGGEGDGD